ATSTPLPVFPLRPGSIEGNLNDQTPRLRYSFSANAGDSVSILMQNTSGDLDPLLILYDPNGEQLERNDDLETGNRDAQIALTLARTGTYVIEATRFENLPTSGTFRLTLTQAGGEVTPTPENPLSRPPNVTVAYRQIDYQEIVAGTLNESSSVRYYVIGATQGDLMRVIITRASGDLLPSLRVLNEQGEVLSREIEAQAGESIALVTLPETGWYVIEAGRREGAGGFNLYAGRIAAAVLEVGQAVTNTFTPTTASLSYIVNARLGDLLTVTMFSSDPASGVAPEVRLLDLALNPVAQESGERFATLRTTIPRSGVYIVEANNLTPAASGGFSLRLGSVPGSERIDAETARYNEQYSGEISAENPLHFYRFAGKTGELVTLTLNATGGDLNPFLILMDSDLNELSANDDSGTRRDSRITQFRLPKDGEYLILASRSGLTAGTTAGSYDLILTAGEIALTGGGLTVTLNWQGDADLNLFVTDPAGRVISWSSPAAPSGGVLQVDSNAACETPSDQPVEHVYWTTPPVGDYVVWVWNQDGCGSIAPVEFTLRVSINGTPILDTNERVPPGLRHASVIRLGGGDGFVVETGDVVLPSPQEAASEGGDALIRVGDALTGMLNNDVYARFYQFEGIAGQTVDIRVERLSGDLDAMLILRDANDNPLPGGANDDADASTRDAHLTYTLPADGTYIIAVTRFGVREGTTTGEYRVTLAAGE
ncbi:MAG: PPC domain-containing protein, partial [Anaerolinea sp.]|nr:PPC domain-containing protein [Anaerolinea sp.]